MLTAFLSIALPLAGRSSEPQEGCASHRAIQTNKEQQKKKRAKLRRNAKVDVDHRLDLGERIYTFLRNISVDEAKKYESTFLRDLSEGYQPTAVLPYGFWGNFFKTEMHLQNVAFRRRAGVRALQFFLQQRATGAQTRIAMRGALHPGACRAHKPRASRASGIDQLLLDFFVDEIRELRCRADSRILMDHARELRAFLIKKGEVEKELPKLIGDAGKMWFMRWRKRHGIVMRPTGMKLKVSWRKVVKRVGVLMRNIFRLRAFWNLLHPGTRMRWLSLDQKPCWFNNAGLTGTYATSGSQPTVREDYNGTRQRYTILTSVPSWQDDPNLPPKMAVLFKGKPNGRIVRGIEEHFGQPLWMKVQVQEKGSYRAEDMIEFLEWALPDANSSEESIIVLLDWFSAHRSDEVEQLVKRKGHVLLFHGGGTTPFTQINDTHLHALVQRLMIEIENQWALTQRQLDRRTGVDHITVQS